MVAAATQVGVASPAPAGAPPDSACAAARRLLAPGARPVALDSVTFHVGGFPVSVCYSRPLASPDDPWIGVRIPYGSVWRTGGDTPAVLYTTRRISFGGVVLPPGHYLLYTVPEPGRWQVLVNRTVSHWADGGGYNAALRGGEVGRAQGGAEGIRPYVPRFTLRPVEAAPNAILFIEWENVRVAIPIVPR